MSISKENNIVQLFLRAANQFPENIAILDKANSINYSDLKEDVIKTASYFSSKGIRNGDRVLVFVPMSIKLYRTVLALFYIGATAVFLDEWSTKERLLLSTRLAKCKGFIGTPKARILGLFYQEIRRIPIKLNLNGRNSRPIKVNEVSKSDSALITFTTGSTGIPKAADRTHLFLKRQFDVLQKKLNGQSTDIEMTSLPIVLFINLGLGSTSFITDFKDLSSNSKTLKKLCYGLRDHKVQRITASPFVIKAIAQFVIDQAFPLHSIKKIFTGGAPVFPNDAKLFETAFPNKVEVLYGSTEAEPISSISSYTLSKTIDIPIGLMVGTIHPEIEVQIIDINHNHKHKLSPITFESIQLENGQLGEILVKGNHVLAKYFENTEAFEVNKVNVEEDIWHRTGDSGIKIGDQLFLHGRVGQLIRSENGSWLSPFIIEYELSKITNVERGTLLKINQELVLIIESKLRYISLDNLVQNFPYDRLIIIDKIPMDPRHQSKIDYALLKKQILEI